MRVLSMTNQRDAGPGVFADAIAAAGAELDQWFRAETDTPPADPMGYDAVMTFGPSAEEREIIDRYSRFAVMSS